MLTFMPLKGQDTLQQMQELYNGTIWIDYLSVLKGDQFLFAWQFRPGTVTIRGKTFPVALRYDIYADQLQIPAGRFGVLQLNKELIDSFSLTNDGKELKFLPIIHDGSKDFCQELYKGDILLYARYFKKIDRINRPDEQRGFYQVNRIYLVKNGDFIQIRGRKDFLELMADRKQEVRLFMRTNNKRINPRDPGSFVPAVKYYDSLTR
jgi:hypothetical protein